MALASCNAPMPLPSVVLMSKLSTYLYMNCILTVDWGGERLSVGSEVELSESPGRHLTALIDRYYERLYGRNESGADAF